MSAHFLVHEIRWLVFVLFAYLSFCLYEDEERKIQNRLEEWWIQIRYRHDDARSYNTRFMQEIALLVGQAFDRVLGKPLFSLRVISASVSFSVASFYIFTIPITDIVFAARGRPLRAPTVGDIAWGALYISFAVYPTVVENRTMFTIGSVSVSLYHLVDILFLASLARPITLAAVVIAAKMGPASAGRFVGFLGFLLVFSLACDISYIALTRRMLRRAYHTERLRTIALIISANLMLMAVVVVLPFLLMLGSWLELGSFMLGAALLFSIPLNAIDFLACFAFLGVTIVMLFHRLVWPIVERPVYAFARLGIPYRRRFLYGLTVLLFPPTSSKIADLLRMAGSYFPHAGR